MVINKQIPFLPHLVVITSEICFKKFLKASAKLTDTLFICKA